MATNYQLLVSALKTLLDNVTGVNEVSFNINPKENHKALPVINFFLTLNKGDNNTIAKTIKTYTLQINAFSDNSNQLEINQIDERIDTQLDDIVISSINGRSSGPLERTNSSIFKNEELIWQLNIAYQFIL